MNPDVVAALDALVPDRVLPATTAARLRRVASGRLVSIRGELQALLYGGVLLVTAGAGLLVKDNLARIGPLAIAVALGLAAAGCLLWTVRRAPAFAWGETPSRDLAFDYVLLLGSLLAVADLAFVEARFSALGPAWPWHLLIVAAFQLGLALRFDSKTLFSLALTSFAAWRGVRLWFVARPWDGALDDRLLVEALACGVGFIVLGEVLERARRKAHFEPVATWLGWVLVLGGLAVRTFDGDSRASYALGLIGCSALLAWFSFDERRVGFVAFGVAGAGWGATALAVVLADVLALDDTVLLLAVVAIVAAVLVVIQRANRVLTERR